MTEPKPDPKPHSAFMPVMLLIVGLLVVAAAAVAFEPLFECRGCRGLGKLTYRDATDGGLTLSDHLRKKAVEDPDEPMWICEWCLGIGKLSAFYLLSNNFPATTYMDATAPGNDELRDRVLQNRKSTP